MNELRELLDHDLPIVRDDCHNPEHLEALIEYVLYHLVVVHYECVAFFRIYDCTVAEVLMVPNSHQSVAHRLTMEVCVTSVCYVSAFKLQLFCPQLFEMSLQGTIPCDQSTLSLIIFHLESLLVHQSLSCPAIGKNNFNRLELLLLETLNLSGLLNLAKVRLLKVVFIIDLVGALHHFKLRFSNWLLLNKVSHLLAD